MRIQGPRAMLPGGRGHTTVHSRALRRASDAPPCSVPCSMVDRMLPQRKEHKASREYIRRLMARGGESRSRIARCCLALTRGDDGI
jgi:hypothetical protein